MSYPTCPDCGRQVAEASDPLSNTGIYEIYAPIPKDQRKDWPKGERVGDRHKCKRNATVKQASEINKIMSEALFGK